MKLVSWNVNGLRACVGKGDFMKAFSDLDADVFCLQETKLQKDQIKLELPGEYQEYWNYAVKKGYSGTAVFTRKAPKAVSYGMEEFRADDEGRMITLEFPEFRLVNVYTPNSKDGLLRLDDRMEWEDAFLSYLNHLQEDKAVIVCGDLNVAHEEIDLKNPKTNRRNAGFTDEERQKMTDLLAKGHLLDSFRELYPDLEGAYSWWSYRFKAREKNAGWRIDYFLISESLRGSLVDSKIHSDIFGSDHCPVELELSI